MSGGPGRTTAPSSPCAVEQLRPCVSRRVDSTDDDDEEQEETCVDAGQGELRPKKYRWIRWIVCPPLIRRRPRPSSDVFTLPPSGRHGELNHCEKWNAATFIRRPSGPLSAPPSVLPFLPILHLPPLSVLSSPSSHCTVNSCVYLGWMWIGVIAPTQSVPPSVRNAPGLMGTSK